MKTAPQHNDIDRRTFLNQKVETMERIREMAGRIAELSNEELENLRADIVTEFKALEDGELSAELVAQMTELADTADAVTEEESRREAELTELNAARELAASRINSPEVTDEETDEVAEEVIEDEVEDEKALSTVETAVEELAVEVTEAAELSETVEAEATLSVETTEEAELAVEEPTAEVELSNGEVAVGEIPAEAELSVETPEETVEVVTAAAETNEIAEDEGEAVTASAETEVEVTEQLEETVTASASLPDEIQIPEENQVVVPTSTPVTITAGADIPGLTAGSEIPDVRTVADAMSKRIHAMRKVSGGDGEQHIVATFSTHYPEDRRLSQTDDFGNSAKVSAVTSPEALVAAGGLCAPVEVRYDVFGFGETKRPVRDSLAVFAADRGGIQFVSAPQLSDLTGAVSLWTLQDDIDAATVGAPDPVKPCIRVACGSKVEVTTDAIPLCLTFGNMLSRANPELVERHIELGMISHARYAETRLLTRIGSLSTAVTTTAELGVARDLLVAVDQAVAGYRNRHRLDGIKLRAILPQWVRNALRADLAKQLPGDDKLALADREIDEFFSVRDINVTWTLDGETGQIIGTQSAGALNAFPTNLVWYLFAEGTFLFLDGGTLDLGLVRDSVLNGTNDYKIFLETFEGVAKVGIESLKVTTPVKLYGASAATVETAV